MSLTPELISRFEADGIIKLPGFLPEELVNRAITAVFDVFARAGIWKDNHWCLEHLPKTHLPAAGSELIKGSKRLKETRALVTPEMMEVVSEFSHRPVADIHSDNMQTLFTRPNADEWQLPASIWHLDAPRLPSGEGPGVQMFTFLNEVESQGGGTLVVAGSHRFLNHQKFIRSKDVKKKLRQKPFFRDLLNKHYQDRDELMARQDVVDDIPVRIVEMTRKPGDVYLTDLRLLHTLSSNILNVPRVMATQRFFTSSSWAEITADAKQNPEAQ